MRKHRIVWLILLLVAGWQMAPLAHGQTPGVTFTALAQFDYTNNGANPYTPPVLGVDGNLYGVLFHGGTNDIGTTYQVTTNGSLTTLYTFSTNFNKSNGANPYAALVSGSDGHLYGVANGGGTNNQGTIFEITTDGVFTVLYSFGMRTNTQGYALDGSGPVGGMVQGKDGNFYGTTSSGGTNNLGTVFQFSTNGMLTNLHSFSGNGANHDGASPYLAPLVEGANGVFYGTTYAGGINNYGTIFRITSGGALTTLLEFNYTDGGRPWAGLSFGTDGKLYGTTSQGGTNGYGTVFQITTNGVLTTLFNFGGADQLYYLYGGVAVGNDNTVFGTTYYYSTNYYGAVFQLTTNGLLTRLHVFTNGVDGANPYAGVLRDASGNLYGAAYYGGTNGDNGTVYGLNFTALLSILSPPANGVWSTNLLTITGTASDNAPGGAITNVYYSLNGEAWTNARTANGWINWTGSGTPTPASAVLTVSTNGLGSLSPNYNGTALQALAPNNIAAYAVDMSGNATPTNTASFLYGKMYSITATPGAGFVFTNWTGGTDLPLTALTNGPTIQFLMASNLMLQANFLDITRPTLSITNVTAGMTVSNADFTVRGKAGDNWQVTNVFYSLNGGDWSNAATTNNWTNWSASVTLVPGTNTVAAYAVDSSGGVSLTNTISFQFVVTNQLQIRAAGFGTISPNYSNAWLQIGRNYSMTATATSGFVFTNWTISTNWLGGVVTNNATVQFMMASNLTLQVTFADVTKPTLSITNLIAGQRVSNNVFIVWGTAGDNWQVSNVLCQLNGGVWNSATNINNWTNWAAGVLLVPGTNTVAAYAVDTTGNRSTTNSVTVQFVVTNLLGVRATGLGTLSPNYSNAWLEVGRNYTMTAAPGSGFVVTNWVISTNWLGGRTTNNAVVQFMMSSNLTLQVNFLDITKPTLTVSSPTAGQHMTNALANLTGTASDNWKVAGVWYQLNSNAWNLVSTTNGYTNWTKTVTLLAGTNSLNVYALDLGGNYSATNSISVVSSNTFKLQLAFATSQPLTSDGLNFILQVSTNVNGRVQVSGDLTNWATLTNFIGTNTTINVRDAAAINYSNRFYRAVTP